MKAKLLVLFFAAFSLPVFSQCWTQVAAGTYHTLAIKSDGTLWAWGLNDNGQLGDGTTVNRNVPVQIGTDANWASIDAEGYNSMALKSDGSLWSWGSNNNGQIGDGNFGTGVIVTSPIQIGSDTDWIKIEAARTFAIKSNGTLWGWGKNDQGHLGTGDTNPYYTPVQIGADSDWVDVSSGGNQTLALKSNGTLWGWGLNHSGSLGIGPASNFVMVPTQTGNNTADWAKISVGGCCSSKMIKTDGTLWAMGGGWNLGNGTTVNANVPTPITSDNTWETLVTSNHSAVIKSDGTLWTWGYNDVGQMGDGSLVSKTSPIQVGIGSTWINVATGTFHTVALDSEGTLFTWGYNNNGQLGDGTFQNKNVPSQIGNTCNLKILDFKRIDMTVFPNPTSNYIMLQYSLNGSTQIELQLVNIFGQEVFRNSLEGHTGHNQFSLDLTNYTTGIYLLTLKTAAGSATVKIIKTSP